MKPKRDYDPEALGVQILGEGHASAISHNAWDRASLHDDAERFAEQKAEDRKHPAWSLRDKPDTEP